MLRAAVLRVLARAPAQVQVQALVVLLVLCLGGQAQWRVLVVLLVLCPVGQTRWQALVILEQHCEKVAEKVLEKAKIKLQKGAALRGTSAFDRDAYRKGQGTNSPSRLCQGSRLYEGSMKAL